MTVASAHPTWSPDSVRRGSTDLELYVPAESSGAFVENSRVDLQLAAGFRAESCTAPDGWACDTGGGDGPVVFERGLRVGGGVDRFPVRLAITAAPGDYRFPVTQTYSDGSGVYWAGDPDDEFAAPYLRVVGSSSTSRPSSPPPTHAGSAQATPSMSRSASASATPTVTTGPTASSVATAPPPSSSSSGAVIGPAPSPSAPGRFSANPIGSDEGSRSTWPAVAALALVLGVPASLLVVRRRRASAARRLG